LSFAKDTLHAWLKLGLPTKNALFPISLVVTRRWFQLSSFNYRNVRFSMWVSTS
jgi:hypothetical protein